MDSYYSIMRELAHIIQSNQEVTDEKNSALLAFMPKTYHTKPLEIILLTGTEDDEKSIARVLNMPHQHTLFLAEDMSYYKNDYVYREFQKAHTPFISTYTMTDPFVKQYYKKIQKSPASEFIEEFTILNIGLNTLIPYRVADALIQLKEHEAAQRIEESVDHAQRANKDRIQVYTTFSYDFIELANAFTKQALDLALTKAPEIEKIVACVTIFHLPALVLSEAKAEYQLSNQLLNIVTTIREKISACLHAANTSSSETYTPITYDNIFQLFTEIEGFFDTQKESQKVVDRITTLIEQWEKVSDDMQHTEEEIKKLYAEQDTLWGEIKEANNEYFSTFDQSVNPHSEKMTALETQNEELDKQRNRISEQIKKLDEERETLDVKIQEIQKEIHTLQEQLREEQNNVLKTKDEKRIELKKREDEINTRLRELEAKRSAYWK